MDPKEAVLLLLLVAPNIELKLFIFFIVFFFTSEGRLSQGTAGKSLDMAQGLNTFSSQILHNFGAGNRTIVLQSSSK